jgi:hypothetical protein
MTPGVKALIPSDLTKGFSLPKLPDDGHIVAIAVAIVGVLAQTNLSTHSPGRRPEEVDGEP